MKLEGQISWKPLGCFFLVLAIPIGRNVAKLMGFSSATDAALKTGFTIVLFAVLAFFLARGAVAVINGTKKATTWKKVMAWGVAAIGLALYFVSIGLTGDAIRDKAEVSSTQTIPATISPKISAEIQEGVDAKFSEMSNAEKRRILSRLTEEEKKILRQYPEFRALFEEGD